MLQLAYARIASRVVVREMFFYVCFYVCHRAVKFLSHRRMTLSLSLLDLQLYGRGLDSRPDAQTVCGTLESRALWGTPD
jgi:hypothetical protein